MPAYVILEKLFFGYFIFPHNNFYFGIEKVAQYLVGAVKY